MKETITNRKYWIFGIIGCICFGIGDWMLGNTGIELANAISNLLGNAMLPCLYIAGIFAGIPLILLMADILCGKTRLKKQEVLFTPLIWMALVNVVANIIPATAFSYGLYTFCMNGGMLVWFIYLLVKEIKRKQQIERKE